jgi:NAD(P)-dependent dehydrogenase (short-subunit alcohol dehydrogenase family)
MLGRWGTAEDIAKVAKFLLSPESQFLNGQILAVNGGWKPAWPAP